jgi:hypothetical protein
VGDREVLLGRRPDQEIEGEEQGLGPGKKAKGASTMSTTLPA